MTYDLRTVQIAINLGIELGCSGLMTEYGTSPNRQFKEGCKLLRRLAAKQGLPAEKVEEEIAKFN